MLRGLKVSAATTLATRKHPTALRHAPLAAKEREPAAREISVAGWQPMTTGEARVVDEWKKKIEMVTRRVSRGGMGGGRSTTELAGARG